MYLSVDHFTNSCSFDFSFNDDPDWTSCTASIYQFSAQPFRLKLSSDYFGDISFVITPLDKFSCIFTDLGEERACLFNPSDCAGDIADDINQILEDDEMSSLIAYTFVSLWQTKIR